MSISFDQRVSLPTDVLISRVQDESVLLNLDSERYFGLDEVGTRFMTLLTTSATIQAAYEVLVEEYDVDAAVLRQDLSEMLEKLLEQGLVKVESD
jgi:Coenzyme PQQ synthesis protein D (PqqD)